MSNQWAHPAGACRRSYLIGAALAGDPACRFRSWQATVRVDGSPLPLVGPYPLSWQEQRLLFSELPSHLARMALFQVNTGTREQEVAQLRWDWEFEIPALEISVGVEPGLRGRVPQNSRADADQDCAVYRPVR